jgi:hypothetical protein
MSWFNSRNIEEKGLPFSVSNPQYGCSALLNAQQILLISLFMRPFTQELNSLCLVVILAPHLPLSVLNKYKICTNRKPCNIVCQHIEVKKGSSLLIGAF